MWPDHCSEWRPWPPLAAATGARVLMGANGSSTDRNGRSPRASAHNTAGGQYSQRGRKALSLSLSLSLSLLPFQKTKKKRTLLCIFCMCHQSRTPGRRCPWCCPHCSSRTLAARREMGRRGDARRRRGGFVRTFHQAFTPPPGHTTNGSSPRPATLGEFCRSRHYCVAPAGAWWFTFADGFVLVLLRNASALAGLVPLRTKAERVPFGGGGGCHRRDCQ